jgi:hypothetical protein
VGAPGPLGSPINVELEEVSNPMRRNFAILSFVLLSLSLATGFAAAQTSNALTTDQVTCNQTQLRNLLERLNLQGAGSQSANLSLTLLVSYSNPFGFFEGLAVANQTPFAVASAGSTRPESFLAFSINPSIRTTLLNPARQPLAQVTLVREETSSNLVASGSPVALNLSLNPTLAGNATSGLLQINNLQLTNGQCTQVLSADLKPGRGLVQAGLTTPCHTLFSDFDRLVFELLERTFRVAAPNNPAQDFKVAIYRGEDPFTYRIDVYPVNANGTLGGPIALELTLATDESGNLRDGSLRVLPYCIGGQTADCSTASSLALTFYLVPPVFGGSQVRLTGDVSVSLSLPANGVIPLPAPFNFLQILGGTSWNG